MTSKYVYLIYDYEEDGPTNMVVTLDFAKLQECLVAHLNLCKAMYSTNSRNFANLYDEYLESFSKKLEKFMADHADQQFGTGLREDLNENWGGTVIEIVQLT